MDIPQGSVFGPQEFRALLGLLRYNTPCQCAFMSTNYKTNYVCQINLGSLLTIFSLLWKQISDAFQKKVQSKIKDLLQQMEEGLKTADPHDSSAYTGWTGESTRS